MMASPGVAIAGWAPALAFEQKVPENDPIRARCSKIPKGVRPVFFFEMIGGAPEAVGGVRVNKAGVAVMLMTKLISMLFPGGDFFHGKERNASRGAMFGAYALWDGADQAVFGFDVVGTAAPIVGSGDA